jgi:hypothetical protein
MNGQIFPSIREAIHHTATASGIPMKSLAADLDYSPTEMSMRTTLGTEGREFPASKLVKLQKLTKNVSILMTEADQLGYELRPKQDRLPDMLQQIQDTQKRLAEAVQLVLSSPWIAADAGGR